MIRWLLVVTLFALPASSALAQTVRVSESSAGVQANGASGNPSMSASGRYVVFDSAATNLVADDTNGASDIFLRDRDTDADGVLDEPGFVSTTRISTGPGGAQANGVSLSPRITGDGRYVTFVSDATNLVSGGTTVRQIYRFDRVAGASVLVSTDTAGLPSQTPCVVASLSADGDVIAYSCFALPASPPVGTVFPGSGTFVRTISTGQRTMLGEEETTGEICSLNYTASPTVSADGRFVAFARVRHQGLCIITQSWSGTVSLYDRETATLREHVAEGSAVTMAADASRLFVEGSASSRVGNASAGDLVWYDRTLVERVNTGLNALPVHAASRDGRYALVTERALFSVPEDARLYDGHYRLPLVFPWRTIGAADFDQTSRFLTFASPDTDVVTGGSDTNDASDVFVADLTAVYDADHDALDDRDETFYGLSTTSGAGADGPIGDPDGDGISNAAEIAAGTHPRGFVKRYLAEGATSSFYRTRFALANTDLDPTHPAGAVLSLLPEGGAAIHLPTRIEPGSRQTVDVAARVGVDVGAFSTLIESDRPIVIDRTMSWDTRPATESGGYGAHTESAADAPGTQWYLAEGATGSFNLYYLLQNPQDDPVDVTIRYLRPDVAPLVRPYTLPPNSRRTIFVNDVDTTLAISDVSADIAATAPIIVERAMYASRSGQPFALGHAARGVTAASTTWFLAEGATGDFFDTYVLIANPSSTPAEIVARFDTTDRGSVTRPYTIAANSRFTILLDTIPGLEASAVSTTITSTSTPVIVERAMYWPNGFAAYYEAHASAATTASGLRWALAEGEEGGAGDAQTFVLIANTGSTVGRVRVTQLQETGADTPIELDLQPNSRTTVRPGAGDAGRFGTLIESIGSSPAPIVVEGAFYRTVEGVVWAAGSGVVATRLP